MPRLLVANETCWTFTRSLSFTSCPHLVHFRPEDRSAASARSAAVWFLFFSAILAITSQVWWLVTDGRGKENTPTDCGRACCGGDADASATRRTSAIIARRE